MGPRRGCRLRSRWQGDGASPASGRLRGAGRDTTTSAHRHCGVRPGAARRGGQVTTDVREAYATCERITRAEARNFYYGIRLLPPAKRAALSSVYALARRIDDIGDGDLPVSDKIDALTSVRKALREADSTDPVMTAVHDPARSFPIELEAFDELVDGVEMDVLGRRYDTFDELVTYCTCVAGTIGRLSLAIFGGSAQTQT